MAQSLHAAVEYSLEYPAHYKRWHEQSNYVICLNADSMAHLQKLELKLSGRGIEYSLFCEPDLGGQPTAISFIEETRLANRVTSSLPLAPKMEKQDD